MSIHDCHPMGPASRLRFVSPEEATFGSVLSAAETARASDTSPDVEEIGVSVPLTESP